MALRLGRLASNMASDFGLEGLGRGGVPREGSKTSSHGTRPKCFGPALPA